MMIDLQRMGCHNINFVTPSHVVWQILEALALAAENGLRVPLVYNSGGYDRVETLQLLEGVFDIYMPDFKFWDPRVAEETCNAPDYPEVARNALREMHRQVGVLKFDHAGVARRGVLVRHLVMPGQTDEAAAIFRWLAEELSPDTFVNIMGQYRPDHRVPHNPRYIEINRRPQRGELDATYDAARRAGLWRFDKARP